jgi:hypothetical protein
LSPRDSYFPIYLKWEGEIEQKDVFGNYWTFPLPLIEMDVNDNELTRTFEWSSAVVGYACDPVSGKCSYKFKPASPFKIKALQTCHYVMDAGRHAEVNLVFR